MFEVAGPPSTSRPSAHDGGRRSRRTLRRPCSRCACCALRGRRVWHVNATAEGGGVAELLGSTLGYLPADGIETHRLVIEADEAFFEITKRIHNRLHGDLGDGGPWVRQSAVTTKT